jgi:hypothetical protein
VSLRAVPGYHRTVLHGNLAHTKGRLQLRVRVIPLASLDLARSPSGRHEIHSSEDNWEGQRIYSAVIQAAWSPPGRALMRQTGGMSGQRCTVVIESQGGGGHAAPLLTRSAGPRHDCRPGSRQVNPKSCSSRRQAVVRSCGADRGSRAAASPAWTRARGSPWRTRDAAESAPPSCPSPSGDGQ